MKACPLCHSTEIKVCKKSSTFTYYKCGNCDLYFYGPEPVKTELFSVFDNYSWTTQHSSLLNHSSNVAVGSMRKKIEAAEKLKTGKIYSMLDVGCGSGLFMDAARQLGVEPVGTEIDRHNFEVARNRGLSVHFGFIEEIDLEKKHSAKFDFMHVKTVLCCTSDPLAMMTEVVEMMADDGVLYVDVNNQHGLFSRARMLLNSNPKRYGQIEPPNHPVGHTTNSFRYLVDKLGLSVEKFFTYSFGDTTYYPDFSGGDRFSAKKMVLRMVDKFGGGGFIGAYCTKR